ncbi:hypothetical protein CFC21_101826 [Triticum aestivum]|uniref:Uncharacterized protein n=2 Tax=Triticum aestivum TaxID=4565 RepID=A0A3B6SDP6_WHEAT|nr:hypothetical protein CFC21_101826 [Triticum aestivum]
MATGAEIFRPLAVTGDVMEAPVLLISTGEDQLVDPVIWGDEERMKRELMAWAKAVASMALNVPAGSSSPLSMGRRQRSQGASRLQLST